MGGQTHLPPPPPGCGTPPPPFEDKNITDRRCVEDRPQTSGEREDSGRGTDLYTEEGEGGGGGGVEGVYSI